MKGKNIVVCVSGGIAVYKIVEVVSRLKKLGSIVTVAMTESATQFVTPLTFQSISNHLVYTDLNEDRDAEIERIALAQKADLFLVAPATANIIGKIANGIADDLVTTAIMATKAPVLFIPAMNTAMYENPIVQQNIEKLKFFGYLFMEPEVGAMAAKGEKEGIGRLPEPESIIEFIKELNLV